MAAVPSLAAGSHTLLEDTAGDRQAAVGIAGTAAVVGHMPVVDTVAVRRPAAARTGTGHKVVVVQAGHRLAAHIVSGTAVVVVAAVDTAQPGCNLAGLVAAVVVMPADSRLPQPGCHN